MSRLSILSPRAGLETRSLSGLAQWTYSVPVGKTHEEHGELGWGRGGSGAIIHGTELWWARQEEVQPLTLLASAPGTSQDGIWGKVRRSTAVFLRTFLMNSMLGGTF